MKIKDFISVEKDIVPASLRDMILREYSHANDWVAAGVGTDGAVDKTQRDVAVVYMSAPDTLSKNMPVRNAIDEQLFNCANLLVSRYMQKHPVVKVSNDSGYDLLRYAPGQFYGEHTDEMTGIPRILSCSFALNEDYSGGEWSFFGGSYVEKLNAGDAIIFPSNFMFPHSVLPVTSGIRYSVVTWFN